MALEIARRLAQDGVTWETVVADEDSGGGSQAFLDVTFQHSAAFSNLRGNAPVMTGQAIRGSITLPPTAFGNNGQVSVVVSNDNDVAVEAYGILIVQNDDGTVWIEQDTNIAVSVTAHSSQPMDFETPGGGAGAGLSWNAIDRQIDIANAGVYSAVVSLFAQPV